MTVKQITKAALKISERIDDIRADIEMLHSDAQEYFDDRSERWQEGEKGQEYQSLLDSLEEAIGDAETLFDTVANIG